MRNACPSMHWRAAEQPAFLGVHQGIAIVGTLPASFLPASFLPASFQVEMGHPSKVEGQCKGASRRNLVRRSVLPLTLIGPKLGVEAQVLHQRIAAIELDHVLIDEFEVCISQAGADRLRPTPCNSISSPQKALVKRRRFSKRSWDR